jgi:hypothetical protein
MIIFATLVLQRNVLHFRVKMSVWQLVYPVSPHFCLSEEVFQQFFQSSIIQNPFSKMHWSILNYVTGSKS